MADDQEYSSFLNHNANRGPDAHHTARRRLNRNGISSHVSKPEQSHRSRYEPLQPPDSRLQTQFPSLHSTSATLEANRTDQHLANDASVTSPHQLWQEEIHRNEQQAFDRSGAPRTSPDSIRPPQEQPVDSGSTSVQVSPLNWKPWSLRHIPYLMILLCCHALLYIVPSLLMLNRTPRTFVTASPAYNWIFQFGPTVAAVFIKEWINRLATDYRSIAPYFRKSLQNQNMVHPKIPLRERPKLYALGVWRSALKQTRFDMLGHLASLLVLIHSAILLTENYVVEVDARLLGTTVESFYDGYFNSRLPALMVPSYFVNQTVTSYTWFSTLGDYYSVGDNNYGLDLLTIAGVLPFRSQDPSQPSGQMSTNTSGLASSLTCDQIPEPEVSMRFSGNSSWDVHVHLLDRQGCGFNTTYEAVKLLSDGTQAAVSYPSGAVGNNTFAKWEYFRSGIDSYVANQQYCNYGLKQFLISGHFDPNSLPDSVETFVPVEAAQDHGWAALSCDSKYILFNNTLDYTIFSNGSASLIKSPTPKATVFTNEDDRLDFDLAMETNFIDTGVFLNLSNMYNGQTFWNAPARQVFPTALDASVFDIYCGESLSSSNLLQIFPNPHTCQMFVNAGAIWSWAFAMSVPLTAAYLPANGWTAIDGTVGKVMTGWYIEASITILSEIIHLIMLIILILSGMFSIRRRAGRLERGATTGLARNPSSIAAKAVLFREPRVRDALTGVDALDQREAEQVIRGRISFLRRFFVRADQLHHTGQRQKPTGQNPYIDIHSDAIERVQADGSRYHNELRNSCALSGDYKKLVRLRFAFASWSVHPGALAAIFVVLCVIFIGGIYMAIRHDDYYLWYQPWLDYNRTSSVDQSLIFSLLPVLVLLFLRWWWSCIDEFFRHTQPYVGLYYSLPGAKSICLNYINDMDLRVTLKALGNRHFRLAFITLNSSLVKLALALSGGLFVYQQAVSQRETHLPQMQTWRSETFEASPDSFNVASLRSVMLHAITGSGSAYGGWQTDTYVMPAVDTSTVDGKYQIKTYALSAELDCEEVHVDFSKEFVNSSLTAHLYSPSCPDLSWPLFCLFRPGLKNGAISGTYFLEAGVPVWDDDDADSTSSSSSSSSSTSAGSASRSSSAGASTIARATGSSTTLSSSDLTTASTSSETTAMSISMTTSVTALVTASVTDTVASTTTRSAVPPPTTTMPDTTDECYNWYTPQVGDYCWQIAEQLGIDWETMRELNPSIDAGCLNLQPNVAYCVDGVAPSRKTRRSLDLVSGRLNGRDEETTGYGSSYGDDIDWSLASDPGSCTGWHYLNSSTCGGRWWIIDAHGTHYSPRADVLGLHNISSSTSLLCKPKYYNHSIDVTVYAFASLGFFNLSVDRVTSSHKISEDTWTATQNDTTVSFSEYFSSSLVQFQFASSFLPLGYAAFFDAMALIAASNSTQSTVAFQDVEAFKQISSSAFSRVFAETVNHTISPDGSTFLMQPVTAGESAPVVDVYEYIWTAHPLPVPLYATLIALALYALAIVFAYPDESRRTPLDPSVPMNVVASMYDSSMMQIVEDSIASNRDPVEDLKRIPFAYGVYRGISTGERRLGIDVADKVDPLLVVRGGSFLTRCFGRWRRRGHSDDEEDIDGGIFEKTPQFYHTVEIDNDSNTELANFVYPDEVDTAYSRQQRRSSDRNLFRTQFQPHQRHDIRDFEPASHLHPHPRGHGPAMVTEYSPAPTDPMSNIDDHQHPQRVRGKSWLHALKAKHKGTQPSFTVRPMNNSSSSSSSDGYASPNGDLVRQQWRLLGWVSRVRRWYNA